MDIKNVLRNRLNEVIDNKVWYHGTPDVRELEKEGGFGERTTSVEYIENIDGYNQLLDKQIQSTIIEVKNARHYIGFNASPNYNIISDMIIDELNINLKN